MKKEEIFNTTIKDYGEIINITIRRKPYQKNTYIKIKDKNNILITTNHTVSRNYIFAFVKDKESWISKHLNKFKDRHQTKQENTIYYQGELYTLELDPNSQEVQIQPDIIIYKNKDQLNNFLHQKISTKLSLLTKYWARIMNLTPTSITIKTLKSQWGNCSRDNRITYNSELIKLPINLMDYIVVHELAHIKHKNHSGKFWSLVQQYIPNHKELRKLLRIWEKVI